FLSSAWLALDRFSCCRDWAFQRSASAWAFSASAFQSVSGGLGFAGAAGVAGGVAGVGAAAGGDAGGAGAAGVAGCAGAAGCAGGAVGTGAAGTAESGDAGAGASGASTDMHAPVAGRPCRYGPWVQSVIRRHILCAFPGGSPVHVPVPVCARHSPPGLSMAKRCDDSPSRHVGQGTPAPCCQEVTGGTTTGESAVTSAAPVAARVSRLA